VRDKDHGAGELAERLEQNIFGAKVQVVGGLVEEQKIRWMQQHAGQRVAVTLAAGKHADGLENVVLGEEKATEQAAQLGLRRPRRHGKQIVEHARLRVERFVLVLGKVIHVRVVAQLD